MARETQAQATIPDTGIPMDELAHQVRSGSTQGPNHMERLGEMVFNRLVDWVTTGTGGPGGGTPADPVKTARDVVGLGKDLSEIEDGRIKRLLDELTETRKQLDELRRGERGEGGGGSMIKMFELLLAQQDKAEARMEKLLTAIREEAKDARDKNGGGTAEKMLASLGLERLQSALTQDPLEVAEQLEERLRKRLERGGEAQREVIDLERWKAQKQWDLDHERLDHEDKREERKEQAQTERLRELRGILGELKGVNAAHGDVGVDEGTAQGVYRYKCAGCQGEFALKDPPPGDTVSCPLCKMELRILPHDATA